MFLTSNIKIGLPIITKIECIYYGLFILLITTKISGENTQKQYLRAIKKKRISDQLWTGVKTLRSNVFENEFSIISPSFLIWLCPKNRPQVHSCLVKTLKTSSCFAQKNWEIGILWGRECRRNPEGSELEKKMAQYCARNTTSPQFTLELHIYWGRPNPQTFWNIEPTRSEPTS